MALGVPILKHFRVLEPGCVPDQIDQDFTFHARPHSTVGSASDKRAGGPRFDTRPSHILSFLLLLIQEGQLSVTGESMCTKYWLTAKEI